MGLAEMINGKMFSAKLPSRTGGDGAALRQAADAFTERVRERFPSTEGWTVSTTDELAHWAWPQGAQNQREARKLLGEDGAARALKRSIFVRRGLTAGLSFNLYPTDRAHTELQVTAFFDSRLTSSMIIGGAIAGVLAAVAIAFTHGAPALSRSMALAAIVGLLAGLALSVGLVIGVIRPIVAATGLQLTDEQGQRHFDDVVAGLQR